MTQEQLDFLAQKIMPAVHRDSMGFGKDNPVIQAVLVSTVKTVLCELSEMGFLDLSPWLEGRQM